MALLPPVLPEGGSALPHSARGAAYAAELVSGHFLKIESEDTLSEALDRHFPNRTWRLYGKKGALARIKVLNPRIPDLNRVFPGMVLDIGEFAETPTLIPDRVPAAAPSPLPLSEPTHTPTPELKQEREVPTSSSQEPSPPSFSADRYTWFTITPTFSFSQLDSSDKSSGSQALLLSKLNPDLAFLWGQHWSDRFQTALQIGTGRESYEYQGTDTQISNSSRTLSRFGARAEAQPFNSPRFAVNAELGVRQRIFLRANGFTSLTLDALTVPEASAGARYHLLVLWPFSLAVDASGTLSLPARAVSFTAQAGAGYRFGGSIGLALSKSTRMRGDIWYSSHSQNSSIATQSRHDIGFTLGLSYRLEFTKPENLKEDDLP